MIGDLPKTLWVNNKEYSIRTDYKIALTIFEALGDTELNEKEKALIMVKLLYEEIPENIEGAIEEATLFLDGGNQFDNVLKSKKVMDWVQDQQMIFSAINKVAGFETRARDYIHWWTFLGYFNEIGEGLFSTVINIRQKKNKGKKLEKYEQEFYRDNKSMIDIKQKYTLDEQIEIDRLNKLLK